MAVRIPVISVNSFPTKHLTNSNKLWKPCYQALLLDEIIRSGLRAISEFVFAINTSNFIWIALIKILPSTIFLLRHEVSIIKLIETFSMNFKLRQAAKH